MRAWNKELVHTVEGERRAPNSNESLLWAVVCQFATYIFALSYYVRIGVES